MAFTHRLPIRYGECDQQGVVFNAHYLAYVDDAMDNWMREVVGEEWVDRWDVMLKSARITWLGPARWPEVLEVDCAPGRLGRTSLDVVHRLRVGDRPVADVLVTYVSVGVGTTTPQPTPPEVLDALGPLTEVPGTLR